MALKVTVQTVKHLNLWRKKKKEKEREKGNLIERDLIIKKL